MTATLLLRLKGPLQSWGDDSRYNIRTTGQVPTKSGVLGLLAAAQGRRRTDPIEDLAGLTFAVRVDQPGTLLKDYQTAEKWQTGGGTRLVTRYFLEDAVFVSAIESEDNEFIESLARAVNSPRFPLFLGRRSCPASPDLFVGTVDKDAVTALKELPWQASKSHRVKRAKKVNLPIFRDAGPNESGVSRQDVPLSFSQEHRKYGWRQVVHDLRGVEVDNPLGQHDDPFMEAVMSV
ncbi:type I-E CRISPR-associated protein Cas5/CasD [Corynebacterium vitaeruminis]|uniref:CRISPR-associated protein n=1 Tax=Corynebacterium vitaeruminis DSM 20294 TaxID=1224164 RepID=W5Y3F7_9CORY|nr:type I-E CRISPR-associated protein Cas5/CasD [Corynebacterium vitaeruminis]AHI23419.1 hypothetical protein B843_10170 [Corynebacterium vitaeruminis DSM 20294]